MNHKEIDLLLSGNTPWRDPANGRARAAFVKHMAGRQYGLEPCLHAWNWYLTGWRSQDSPPSQTPQPFIVKHYAADERPSIKGNGFDGLEIGEDREEAENFVAWINARLVARPDAAERDAFEVWAKDHYWTCTRNRYDRESYQTEATQVAWWAWRARAGQYRCPLHVVHDPNCHSCPPPPPDFHSSPTNGEG